MSVLTIGMSSGSFLNRPTSPGFRKLLVSHPPATIATATQAAKAADLSEVGGDDTRRERLSKRKASSFPRTFFFFCRNRRCESAITRSKSRVP